MCAPPSAPIPPPYLLDPPPTSPYLPPQPPPYPPQPPPYLQGRGGRLRAIYGHTTNSCGFPPWAVKRLKIPKLDFLTAHPLTFMCFSPLFHCSLHKEDSVPGRHAEGNGIFHALIVSVTLLSPVGWQWGIIWLWGTWAPKGTYLVAVRTMRHAP